MKPAPTPSDFDQIITIIRRAVAEGEQPSVSQVAGERPDPFKVLLSTIISLRTRDEVTIEASRRLFERADSPASVAALSVEEIERLIYPAGFYRTKAKNIREIASRLIDGGVPRAREELLALPGVGVKTANLTLSLGYGLPFICVDIHVHRISNRMGWVDTKTPEQTEVALMEVLPRSYWIEINGLLVSFGQRVCTPQSPRCSICPVEAFCAKRGVTRSR